MDPHKRKLLEREFKRYDVKGTKILPRAALTRLPFKSVRLRKADCTDGNVRLMPTGHRFKVSNVGGTRVNEAIVVYRTKQGSVSCYAVKNRRAFGPTAKPEDFASPIVRIRPGDRVTDEQGRALGLVVKVGSGGTLTFANGKTKSARRCRKGGEQ